jgi:XTP/dITP diphosphohydrolase
MSPDGGSVVEGFPSTEKVVVVATGNLGKLEEIRAHLAFPGWRFVPAHELGPWNPPEEIGATFAENALAKARFAADEFGRAALADDSGLEVDALDGEPGVYSARYAGPCAADEENTARLLLALGGVPEGERVARFRCCMALVDSDGTETLAEGACEGAIGFEPRGTLGFGYDPVFLPDATPGRTMAELELAEKNVISHRGAALGVLREAIAAREGRG